MFLSVLPFGVVWEVVWGVSKDHNRFSYGSFRFALESVCPWCIRPGSFRPRVVSPLFVGRFALIFQYTCAFKAVFILHI